MAEHALVYDVTDDGFASEVIERSRDVPVVVDFWAAWCGPCRTLGPMLESAVRSRGGQLVLAKVDVDGNPGTAQAHRVQGIPQVFGYRDGEIAGQFTGVVPPDRLEAFLDDLVPSETDLAVARARDLEPSTAAEVLRTALADDPGHRDAALALAELVVGDDPDEAVRLASPHVPDPRAEAVAIRAELAAEAGADLDALRARVSEGSDPRAPAKLARALAARDHHDEAIEVLLEAVSSSGDAREPAREQLLGLFALLGDEDVRVRAARPRLARALY